MSNCIEINKTYPPKGDCDDILICIASPEKRCLGILNKLHNNYYVKKAIIIKYEHKCSDREKNVKLMHDALKSKSDMVHIVTANEDAIVPKIAEVISIISECVKDLGEPKIAIDISTIIKWHLLILLKAIARKQLFHFVRFLYTEPQDYILDVMQPLSFGNKGVFPVPFFQGNYDFSLETCLILMLGYEGQRAMAIFEAIDPEKCILLIPNPPYKPEWEGRTEKMNKEIINIVGQRSLNFVDSRNPHKVTDQICKIISDRHLQNYNHIFAPLGPKPQLIGLFDYYMQNHETTNIVYVSPLRHNPLYSTKIGKSWIIKDRYE